MSQNCLFWLLCFYHYLINIFQSVPESLGIGKLNFATIIPCLRFETRAIWFQTRSQIYLCIFVGNIFWVHKNLSLQKLVTTMPKAMMQHEKEHHPLMRCYMFLKASTVCKPIFLPEKHIGILTFKSCLGIYVQVQRSYWKHYPNANISEWYILNSCRREWKSW